MSNVKEIAERYVERTAALDPVYATSCGIAGHDHLMTDLTPAGFAARADLDRATIAELQRAQVTDEHERVAQEAMLERLTVADDLYQAGAVTSELNVIASWIQGTRQIFDLMPVDGEEAQRNIAARMAALPAAYAGLRQTYLQAATQGKVAARRQVIECARQCAEWSNAEHGFYAGLVARTNATGAIRSELELAATAASAATAQMGEFLQADLLPLAPE